MDTGQNDQNRLVPFATVGNLEKFCRAETIYINKTFKASPQLFHQLFKLKYILCTMASTYVTQSTASQHLVHIGSITFFNFLKCTLSKLIKYIFPTSSSPTLAIPTLSTLTKWELTKWELMMVEDTLSSMVSGNFLPLTIELVRKQGIIDACCHYIRSMQEST